jgi:hypothetical protein
VEIQECPGSQSNKEIEAIQEFLLDVTMPMWYRRAMERRGARRAAVALGVGREHLSQRARRGQVSLGKGSRCSQNVYRAGVGGGSR